MPRLVTGVLDRPERLASINRARRMITAAPEPVNGLVRLAARAVVAPAGFFNLIDRDRMRVLASHGPQIAPAFMVDRAASASLCQYVVADDAPLVVRDARLDGELRDHPAVRDLGAVAYIGHPVHDAAGNALGSLCVLDTVPRRWTDDDVTAVGEAAHLLEVMLNAESVGRSLALTTSETEAVLDTTVEAFVTIELSGEIVRWNSAAERTFGWPAAEAIGRHVDELIIPERFRPAHRGALRRMAAGGQGRVLGQRLRLWALHRDGREFPVELTLNVVDGPEGRRAHGFIYDISDRVAAERQLIRDRGFLAALLDSLDVGVAACDEQGQVVLFNQVLREFTGANAESQPVAHVAARYSTFYPDGRPIPADDSPLSRAFRGERLRDWEFRHRPPGRRISTLVANGQPIRDPDGARLGAVIAIRDITDSRRTKSFVQCELAVSRVLTEAGTTEEAGRGVLEAVARTLGWPHAELWLLDQVAQVLRPAATWTDPRLELTDFLPEMLHSGEGLAGRAWERGEPVRVADLAAEPQLIDRASLVRQGIRAGLSIPVRNGSAVLGALTVFGDVVEMADDSLIALLSGIAVHVGHYLERLRSEELALELVRTKDAFIALVGHELRTPLTSISAYTELLRTEDPDPELREQFLGVIHRNAERLRAVVDDLLDLAGMESGYVVLSTHPVDLSALVREAVDAGTPAAADKQLTLTADVPETEVLVDGDTARLRQMIEQLVANATQYTPGGGRVDVRLTEEGGGVNLTVADTGIGIPPKERQRLFERFFRASNALNQAIPGTGLGLAITRTIVERHGGTITASDREDGPGTVFLVRLPAR